MLPRNPFNTELMAVDDFITKNKAMEVSSHNINSASSTDFHPEGLFSEEIFGQIGTPERFVTFGFIRLNCRIFQPQVYRTIIQLKQIYSQIMAGTIYAKFDKETQDLIRCDQEDKDANTGYSWFMSMFPKIKFKDTGSQKRRDKIELLQKYKDRLTCNKLIVIPAGVRDLKNDGGMLAQDDINKIYLSALSFGSRIPPNTTNPIFDAVKMNIQKKAYEVYLYIENIMRGKNGFLEGNVGARKISLGTRNVISAADLSAKDPKDPQYLKHNETGVPLFQAAKAFQPVVSYHLKKGAFAPIFIGGASQIPLINKKTMELEYVGVDSSEINRFISPDGVETILNRFKNVELRHKPITVQGQDKKWYYLYLVYEKDDKIIIVRNVNDLKSMLKDKFDKTALRPMTWAEIIYLATLSAVDGKHVFVTRYPVLLDGSCYPSKVHLLSTSPGRVVTIVNLANEEQQRVVPEYPVLDGKFIDTTVVHFNKLRDLDGDFDGDTTSVNGVMADDVNEQITIYLDDPRSTVMITKNLKDSGYTKNIKMTLYNMSKM